MSEYAKPLPQYLADRYRSWKALRFEENRAWYGRLAADGQRPRTMVVSCCDSRMDVVGIFGAEPGDLFVVRNVANIIPPYTRDHAHHGTSAAVEYAIKVLKVANVVIIGHSLCGGVTACHDMCAGEAPELMEEDSIIGRWVDLLQPAYERVASLDLSRKEKIIRLEHEGVIHSLGNLETFPCVQEALEKDEIAIHGAWINIANGALEVYDRETGEFAPLRSGSS